MGAKAFLDTNVLLRARIKSHDLHREATKLLDTQLNNDVELWISRQVIREFLVHITRPQSVSQPMTALEAEVEINLL